MKTYRIYFILFVLVFLLGLVLEKGGQQQGISDQDIRSFRQHMEVKHGKLMDIMGRMMDSFQSNEFTKESAFESYQSLFEQNDFVVAVYRKDELLFWSENTFPYQHIRNHEDEAVLKIGNGWYWRQKIQEGNLEIFGFMLLKNVYPYKNSYIHDHFQKDFHIPPTIKILKDEDVGHPIYDSDRHYLFSLSEKGVEEKEKRERWAGIFYLAGIFLFLLFILRWNLQSVELKTTCLKLLISFVGFVLIRYVMIYFEFPAALYGLKFFDPTYYASSSLIPSLGDLILHLLFIGVLMYPLNMIVRNTQPSHELSSALRLIYTVLFLFLNAGMFLFFHGIFRTIIYNSSFPLTLYNLLDISIYSVMGIFAIFLLIIIYALFVDLTSAKVQHWMKGKHLVIVSFVILTVFGLIIPTFEYNIKFISFLFFFLLNGMVFYVNRKKIKYNYTHFVVFILLITLFVTFFIDYHSGVKERQKRKVLVASLENERDLVGEYLLKRLEKQLARDTVVSEFIETEQSDISELENYLSTEYFSGFFRKYDLEISVCHPDDDILQIYDISLSDYAKCRQYRQMIEEEGQPMPGSSFYFLDNMDNQISYLGSLYYKTNRENERILFVLLNSKLTNAQLGYPELLLDEEVTKEGPLGDYTYAKYRNGQLIRHSGDYTFPLRLIDRFNTSKEYVFRSYENYNHLIYNSNPDTTILISKQQKSLLDILAQVSYLFVFFYLVFVFFSFLRKVPTNIQMFNYNFKNKIKLSMILLLLVSLMAVGYATVYYTIDQFQKKQRETITAKLQSIIVELEDRFVSEEPLDKDYSNYLTNLLTKYSNVFYVDMNLYNLDGVLLASSRPQIFERNLLGERMNPKAFQKLSYYEQPRYIHNEQIGTLEYHSAYVPLYNEENERLAYLNLPYFTRQKALKKEIYTIVMVMVNIYVFLIILGVITAVLVSNNITRPLRLIQERLKQIGLHKRNEKINYTSHDEVGELIGEYNRMVEELDEKAQQLAQTERESAWREMAKQIAHEIKNPLTPMKLQVQYLKRAWEDQASDFGERLQQFTQSMINQINSLSGIATEFSNFAKMPRAKKELLNIDTEIQESISLFKNTRGVELKFTPEQQGNCLVFVDKDQVSRVFSNLVKNGIQAIPSGRKGIIAFHSDCDEDYVYVTVEDNGSGIPESIREKLFHPNFTTKSSGMGMGLAISRKIIEDFGGELWYETEEGIGTRFHVKLPKATEND